MSKGLAVIAVLLCGCDLYFGGGGDDAPCAYGNGGAAEPAYYEVRDPQTGVCQGHGGGGGGWCEDRCGPCPGPAATDAGGAGVGAIADWGSCYSQCSGLDQQACYATSGCYAAFLDDANTDGPPEFWGCWQTAPSGPIQGQCANLDAYSCSRHDDCIAIYSGVVDGMDSPYPGTKFASCAAESDEQACDVITCGTGYHCEEQCYSDVPMTGSCEAVCVADLTCANVDCAPGYTCTQVCVSGTNGTTTCYPTCMPEMCGNSQNPCPLACELLTTESACSARADCVPVYDGDQCTCYPTYCECQVLTYDHCETL
jgi:hypothetical protein